MQERKIRKAYEIINKGWSHADVVELLNLTYNQLHAILYGIKRQAQPHQLTGVLSDVDKGMSFSEIDRMVDNTLAGKPYNFNPKP